MKRILFFDIRVAVLLPALLSACGTHQSPQQTLPPASAPASHASFLPDLTGVWALAAPMQGLRTGSGDLPPMLPAARALYEKHQAALRQDDRSWDPVTLCKPPGEPRTMWEMPFEIVQVPNRIEFLYQWNHLIRAVPILPRQQAFMGPFYFGQSVGGWQGSALLVDVIGVSADTYLDSTGLPHSDAMHLIERFTLSEDGLTLSLSLDVDDPMTYSQPWQAQVQFIRKPAGTLVEDDCEQRLHQESRYPVLPTRLYPK